MARPLYQYSPRKYADVRGGSNTCSAKTRLALFAIVKLRTLQTSVMGS